MQIDDKEGSAIYPLSENREIVVKGPIGNSIVKIHDEKAFFISSPCPNELCVQSGAISKAGKWAACLPNEIFMVINGGETPEVDAYVY